MLRSRGRFDPALDADRLVARREGDRRPAPRADLDVRAPQRRARLPVRADRAVRDPPVAALASHQAGSSTPACFEVERRHRWAYYSVTPGPTPGADRMAELTDGDIRETVPLEVTPPRRSSRQAEGSSCSAVSVASTTSGLCSATVLYSDDDSEGATGPRFGRVARLRRPDRGGGSARGRDGARSRLGRRR